MELFKIWATMIAPVLATILISLTYLPQIIKTYRTKSVKDMSVAFWVLLIGFLICMMSNATYLLITTPNGLGYFLTELANFALAVVVLGQIIYYTKKNKNKKPTIAKGNITLMDVGPVTPTKNDSIVTKVVKTPEEEK